MVIDKKDLKKGQHIIVEDRGYPFGDKYFEIGFVYETKPLTIKIISNDIVTRDIKDFIRDATLLSFSYERKVEKTQIYHSITDEEICIIIDRNKKALEEELKKHRDNLDDFNSFYNTHISVSNGTPMK